MKQIFAGPVGTCSTAIPTISFVIVGIGFLLAVIILIGWYILENKYKKKNIKSTAAKLLIAVASITFISVTISSMAYCWFG